jgi:hypothetical protein
MSDPNERVFHSYTGLPDKDEGPMTNRDRNKNILRWCDSVENTFHPRQEIPRGENPKLISEVFLAIALEYLRFVCKEEINE